MTILVANPWQGTRKAPAMSEVCCKRCGAVDHVKNGIVRGFQRYLCLSCGCNFTPPRDEGAGLASLRHGQRQLWLHGFLVAVMAPHAKGSSTKSASKARRSPPMIGRAITASSLMTNSSPQRPDRSHRTGQQQHPP